MRDTEELAPHLPENLWGYGKRLRFVDDALLRTFPEKPRRSLTVLDIGCGNGSQLAIPLADAGYRVTAIDPDGPSIERGQNSGSAVRFLHGTVSVLPEVSFDCVILSEVLEHLEAPEILLEKALPYIADQGILVVTVPNGYGEFEIDRRLYQRLRLDRLSAWLHSFQQATRQSIASSDCESPHLQRFTLNALYHLFNQHDLRLVEARGTSLLSGPIVAHLFGRLPTFVRFNAQAADRMPLSLASGWMFVLQRPA